MHFHLWHRTTAKLEEGRARYMFKFQFQRTWSFWPVPGPLAFAVRGDNLFTPAGNLTHGNSHAIACAAVWAALSGKPLPREAAVALQINSSRDTGTCVLKAGSPIELGVASGAVSTAEVLSVLAPALAAQAESYRAGHVTPQPSGDTYLAPARRL